MLFRSALIGLPDGRIEALGTMMEKTQRPSPGQDRLLMAAKFNARYVEICALFETNLEN